MLLNFDWNQTHVTKIVTSSDVELLGAGLLTQPRSLSTMTQLDLPAGPPSDRHAGRCAPAGLSFSDCQPAALRVLRLERLRFRGQP